MKTPTNCDLSTVQPLLIFAGAKACAVCVPGEVDTNQNGKQRYMMSNCGLKQCSPSATSVQPYRPRLPCQIPSVVRLFARLVQPCRPTSIKLNTGKRCLVSRYISRVVSKWCTHRKTVALVALPQNATGNRP